MAYMKRLVADVMELFEDGVNVYDIAARLDLDEDFVQDIVESYSNFYD